MLHEYPCLIISILIISPLFSCSLSCLFTHENDLQYGIETIEFGKTSKKSPITNTISIIPSRIVWNIQKNKMQVNIILEMN
ncbi:UNVERIFIED_CONTAM: hypothetical protein NCL1_44966 [Trichonephila clavipes]